MKNAYYFSHDTNAKSDPKIMAMRNVYGSEGYGWYWIVVEILADETDYKLAHKPMVYNALALAMLCDAVTSEKFVGDCVETFELFDSDGEFFWSNSLNRRLEKRDEKSVKRSEAGKKGAEKRWNNARSKGKPKQAHGKAMASDSNKIKGNEMKVNKTKQDKDTVPSGTQQDEPYKLLFDHYLSLGLIKHRRFTPEMKNAIDIAKHRGGYNFEDLTELLNRHALIVEASRNDGDYAVRQRGIAEFFGQKVRDGTSLICSEYSDDGAKWRRYQNGDYGGSKPKNANPYFEYAKGMSE